MRQYQALESQSRILFYWPSLKKISNCICFHLKAPQPADGDTQDYVVVSSSSGLMHDTGPTGNNGVVCMEFVGKAPQNVNEKFVHIYLNIIQRIILVFLSKSVAYILQLRIHVP